MIRHLRWYIVGLLTLVTSINYLDRQTLSVAQTVLESELGITKLQYGRIVSAFLIAYGLMHPLSGRVMDWLGSRRGLILAFLWWSAVSIGHAFAAGFRSLAAMRFLLGVGESANFPAAIKMVGEWFPAKERALATGIINVGTGVGAALAPPLVGLVILQWGWRAAFIVTGAIGIIWLIPWMWLARRPEEHPLISREELDYIRSDRRISARPSPVDDPDGDDVSPGPPAASASGRTTVWEALRHRELWVLMLARGLTDPVWLFFAFWIPKYFQDARGFDLTQIALFAWMPFLAADVGSVAGGWLSSFFVRRGYPVLTARKLGLCLSAAVMPLGALAVHTRSAVMAVLCLCAAAFGHQSWAASQLTLPADLFPRRIVASCYGVPAMAGVLGGALTQWYVGALIQRVGYTPAFTIAGCLHPVGAMAVVLFIRSRGRAAPPAAPCDEDRP